MAPGRHMRLVIEQETPANAELWRGRPEKMHIQRLLAERRRHIAAMHRIDAVLGRVSGILELAEARQHPSQQAQSHSRIMPVARERGGGCVS
jgi:hypothetical protein